MQVIAPRELTLCRFAKVSHCLTVLTVDECADCCREHCSCTMQWHSSSHIVCCLEAQLLAYMEALVD